jgi:hypothetical protein
VGQDSSPWVKSHPWGKTLTHPVRIGFLTHELRRSVAEDRGQPGLRRHAVGRDKRLVPLSEQVIPKVV